MSRKTATAVKEAQPDLLGKVAQPAEESPTTKAKQQVAKAEPNKKAKSALAVVTNEPKSMLAIIAGAAADPRVDVSKMKELLTMQREIEERQEAREFNIALLATQNEIPKIVKDRANDHTKSKYATLEKVSREVDHIARRNGFTMTFGTDDSPLKDHYRIVCDLAHTGGHVRRYKIDLQGDAAGSQGKSNKTPIQGVGSTMSYGRRYLKVMIFDLIIVGEDRDGNRGRQTEQQRGPAAENAIEGEIIQDDGVPKITQKQHDELVDALEAKNVTRKKFCEVYQIAKVSELPAERFSEVMQYVKAFVPKGS